MRKKKVAAIELSLVRAESFKINFVNGISEAVLRRQEKIDPSADNDEDEKQN